MIGLGVRVEAVDLARGDFLMLGLFELGDTAAIGTDGGTRVVDGLQVGLMA